MPERRRDRILIGQRDRGLQPIGAVVAHEDAHRGVGDPALQVRAQQLVALLLVLGHLHALGEARLRVRVLGLAGGLRFGCGAPRAAADPGAVGDPDADEAEHAAQQQDRLHRDQGRGPQLLRTVAVEHPLKPAVGGEEGVECLVAGDGIGAAPRAAPWPRA